MKKEQALYIEKISSHLRDIDEIPLFGNAEPLNLEDLSSQLAQQIGLDDLTVRIHSGQWKEKEKGSCFPIYLSPIEEPIFWYMSKKDVDKLTNRLFSNHKKTPISQSMQEGFYRYLLLEALFVASTLDPIQQMTFILEEEAPLPTGDAYAFDVEISANDFTAWGKCIITNRFRKNWVQHFSAFPPHYTSTQLSRMLPLEIGIQIGSVQLPITDVKKLKTGDVIIPDVLANDERATLILDKLTLFQVHIHKQKNQIELLSFAINTEDSMEESEINFSQKLESVEQESKSFKEIPLHISVELARLKIPLDQLMSLSPGNFIELPPLSDKKVSLIANGQKIGVAELVQLGETLGLKLLEI